MVARTALVAWTPHCVLGSFGCSASSLNFIIFCVPPGHVVFRCPSVCPLSFVICHLLFVICHLSFVICHLSSLICHMPFVMCHLSVISHVPCVICQLGYETQCIIVSSAMQSIIQKSYSAKLIRAVPRLRWMLWLMMLCRDCGR